MKKVKLSLDEANIIAAAMDTHIKTHGVAVAEPCVKLLNKLKVCFEDEIKALQEAGSTNAPEEVDA